MDNVQGINFVGWKKWVNRHGVVEQPVQLLQNARNMRRQVWTSLADNAKVAVVMLSAAFLQDEACMQQLGRITRAFGRDKKDFLLPVLIDRMDPTLLRCKEDVVAHARGSAAHASHSHSHSHGQRSKATVDFLDGAAKGGMFRPLGGGAFQDNLTGNTSALGRRVKMLLWESNTRRTVTRVDTGTGTHTAHGRRTAPPN